MNLPSTTLASNPVARSSIARTSTSVTPRCSMRSSAWPVNERSQFHHSGNVGIERLGRADRSTRSHDQKAWQIPSVQQGTRRHTTCAERPVLNQALREGEQQGGTGPTARGVPLWIGSASRISFWSTERDCSPRQRAETTVKTSSRLQADRRRAALCAARLVAPLPERAPTPVSWRERPRDLTASAIMPAATAEVAHATLAGCHRLRRSVRDCGTRRSDPDGISEADRRGFRSAFPPWLSDSDSETADAARGAATKSGGWRSSGTLSCQSKPMVDEPVSARAALASLSTPTTCKLRGRTPSAAFCAAHETHLAGVTDGAGA